MPNSSSATAARPPARPLRLRLLAVLGLLAGLAAPGPSRAAAEEETPLVTAAPAEGAIRIDGVLDEPAWIRAQPIPDLVQQSPHSGQATPFRTEVRLLRSADVLYVAARCEDPDPSRIAVHTLQRDDDFDGDDTFTILLDTFGDRTSAYLFMVNAGGARTDGLVAGIDNLSFDWDGVWEASVARDASGWTVEMAIPSRTLRFAAGRPEWGLNVVRYVARERMSLKWVGTSLDARPTDLRRAGTLGGLAGLKQGSGVSVSPYALGRASHDRSPRSTAASGDAGVDVLWNATSSLSAVATINTDFAETEVDSRQINLTRFPLFFPEKRTFFSEGSNQFDFGLGLGNDFIPFFSRRVGLFQGNVVPLLAGVKVIGKEGPVGIALLDVRTDGAPSSPATNLFAGRLAWDVGSHWRFGAIGTAGDPDGIHRNDLEGADVAWRTTTFLKDKSLNVGAWAARTGGDLAPPSPSGAGTSRPPAFQIGSPSIPAGPDQRSGWGFRVEYPNDLLDTYVAYKDLGDALRPALGFLPRPGVRILEGGAAFQPRPKEGSWASWARQFFFEAYFSRVEDLDGRTESREIFLAPFNVRTQSGEHFEIHLEPSFESLDAPFQIAPKVAIPPGAYPFQRYEIEGQSSEHRPWSVGTWISFGTFYSGSLVQIQGYSRLAPTGGRIQFELTEETDRGSLPQGEFAFRLWQIRAVLAFTPDAAIDAFAQYDSDSRELGLNTRFRWTFHPGADLFVVWNRNWRRAAGENLSALAPRDDQIVVKVRYSLWP